MSVLLDGYTDAALHGDRARAAELATEFAGRDESCLRLVTQLLAPSQPGEDGHRTVDRRRVAGTASGSFDAGRETSATTWPEIDADVVGVSVTLAANLTGAARTVRVARQAGFGVICGGRAFDPSGSRARAIGAHGQPVDLTEPLVLDEVLWGEPLAVDMDADWAHLESQRVEVVRDALSWLGTGDFADRVRSVPWLAEFTADLDEVVGAGAAAILCGDRTIIVEQRRWLEERLAAAGTPVEVARHSFDAVAAVVDQRVPGASALFN